MEPEPDEEAPGLARTLDDGEGDAGWASPGGDGCRKALLEHADRMNAAAAASRSIGVALKAIGPSLLSPPADLPYAHHRPSVPALGRCGPRDSRGLVEAGIEVLVPTVRMAAWALTGL